MTEDSSGALRFLPVGLNLRERNCLVVGGGTIGTHKVFTLLGTGAVVTVLSPTVSGELDEQIRAGRVRWLKDSFREEHLAGVFLAVAATDDEAVNAAVVHAAVRRGALVCDASSAERSRVVFGALFEGDGFTVAVFTGGRDPVRAKRIRDRIADFLAEERPSKPQP